MNLSDVIETLIEERNLDREAVISIVKDGVRVAYAKKYPTTPFEVKYNNKSGEVEVYADKEVVSAVEDPLTQISLRKAKTLSPTVEAGATVLEPFSEPIGRVEMMIAKQYIANNIRGLEQGAVYELFKQKEGTVVNGMLHKRERAGYVVKMGDTMAFLPRSCTIPEENLRVGYPVRALLKEVLPQAKGEHQLILDRVSADFAQKLLELEIPEVFEGVVQIKAISRIAGYKTKVVVASNSPEIDPVGTCVGVGGVRIKPILNELGREKVDLIEHSDEVEQLIARSLKPAEIDKVFVDENGKKATVWLDHEQRSFAIGKQGQNITLVSRLTGYDIQLQEDASGHKQAEQILQQHVEEESQKSADSSATEENTED